MSHTPVDQLVEDWMARWPGACWKGVMLDDLKGRIEQLVKVECEACAQIADGYAGAQVGDVIRARSLPTVLRT